VGPLARPGQRARVRQPYELRGPRRRADPEHGATWSALRSRARRSRPATARVRRPRPRRAPGSRSSPRPSGPSPGAARYARAPPKPCARRRRAAPRVHRAARPPAVQLGREVAEQGGGELRVGRAPAPDPAVDDRKDQALSSPYGGGVDAGVQRPPGAGPAAGDLHQERDRGAGAVVQPAAGQPAGGEPVLQNRQNGCVAVEAGPARLGRRISSPARPTPRSAAQGPWSRPYCALHHLMQLVA
jgi:hypothetical protein